MLKNAAAALEKSSVRQIKTNGPKLKSGSMARRNRDGIRGKKRKEKEESRVNFLYLEIKI